MESRLNILSESLDKKIQVLEEIREYNRKQEQAFKDQQADMDSFDEAVEEKDRLIEKLMQLDEGFETFYERLTEELKGNTERYAAQIKELQGKIARITEMGVSIQAQEARNKKLIEEYFANARRNISQSRRSSKAAYDYYKNMSASAARQAESRIMDSKQ